MSTTSTGGATSARSRPGLHRTLWVLQWLLGIALITAGVYRLALPLDQAVETFPWAADWPTLFTITAVLDLLGGLGILVPSLTRIVPRLAAVAAAGVVLLMLSAIVFYIARGEAAEIVPNVVIAIAAAVVAWGRGWAEPIRSQLPPTPTMAGPLPEASPPPEMRIFQLPTGTYMTRAAFAFSGGAFTDQRHFASTAVLIQHPQGDILLDAGFGAHAEDHINMLPSFRRSPHELAATASDQLDAIEYDRSKLRGVLLTHSHWDHVSGLDSLDAPIWMTAEERQYAADAKDDTVFTSVSGGHEVREYNFKGPAYLGFAASHDFYGDGSVVIVPAAGHTTGSVIIFVALPGGQRYAFIGDLTWQLDGITTRVQRPLMMRMLADSDAKKVRQDLERIIPLTERMQIVPAHDTRGYVGIPLLASSVRDSLKAPATEDRS